MTTPEALAYVTKVLEQVDLYRHAASVVQYDMETVCPPKGMSRQGEVGAFLANQAFRLTKDDAFIEAAEALYSGRDGLNEFERALADKLHREYLRTRRMTAEDQHEQARVSNQAYVDWISAKEADNFSLFAHSLEEVRRVEMKSITLMDNASPIAYDNLLDTYERGMTSAELDRLFGACRERLVPLLRRIMASKKKIRRDFLTRPVNDRAQEAMARYLLTTIGFDFSRGALGTTEHPFTDGMGQFDERVTTNYDPKHFLTCLYSVIHEGGHALFDMNQPAENWKYYMTDVKTMGQHESVSRFYENRIGRSEAFIGLIYPKLRELFPELMADVSARELYEAVNYVEPSLIRTEADEFTYTFHIMIRYEIEKEIVRGNVSTADLPRLWNDTYEKYLGIRPSGDRDGILQDVHWTGGFGYFPTYALGNMYNAMYYNRMKEELDIDKAVSEGRFDLINGWMREHVFQKADRLAPRDWIRDITGRDLTPDDFLDYLEKKYTAIYELD